MNKLQKWAVILAILAYPLGVVNWFILNLDAIRSSPIRDIWMDSNLLITQINVLAVILAIIGTGRYLLERQKR